MNHRAASRAGLTDRRAGLGDGGRGGERGRGGRGQHVARGAVGAGRPERAGAALGQRRGQDLDLHDAEHSVRADARPAVAQPAHQIGREVELGVGIGQDHEVVLRAVSLREVHLPMLSGVAAQLASPPSR